MDRKSKGNNTRLLQVEVGVFGVGGGGFFHVYQKKKKKIKQKASYHRHVFHFLIRQ